MRLERPLRPFTPSPRLYLSYLYLSFIYYWIKVEMKLRIIEETPTPTITFKKMEMGTWSRDDGKTTILVGQDAMYREIMKLIMGGWDVTPHGVIHGTTYQSIAYELTRTL